MLIEEETISFGAGLNGILTNSRTPASNATVPVILTHGAGQGMNSPLLSKTATRLAEKLACVVLRFNFAYIDKKSAPSAGGKKELPDLLAAIEYMQQYGTEPILIGKSFGARVCANAALETKARALVFYGMPLQGMSPGAKPRDWSHLRRIESRMLFITGDKDKLCPLDKLAEVLKDTKAEVTSQIVAGDHSFKPKSEDLAVKICVEWLESSDKFPTQA